jgi:hypothetical protein
MTDAFVDPRPGVPSRPAVALGGLHADAANDPTAATVEASVAEAESLYDTAGLIRRFPGHDRPPRGPRRDPIAGAVGPPPAAYATG